MSRMRLSACFPFPLLLPMVSEDCVCAHARTLRAGIRYPSHLQHVVLPRNELVENRIHEKAQH